MGGRGDSLSTHNAIISTPKFSSPTERPKPSRSKPVKGNPARNRNHIAARFEAELSQGLLRATAAAEVRDDNALEARLAPAMTLSIEPMSKEWYIKGNHLEDAGHVDNGE